MFLIFLLFLLIGPRFTTVMWWILNPDRFSLAFTSSILVPILGILFVPWTTLMYVGIFPGGITGFDWLWMGLALMADISSYAGSAYRAKSGSPATTSPTPPPTQPDQKS